jgi:hypothetical protein
MSEVGTIVQRGVSSNLEGSLLDGAGLEIGRLVMEVSADVLKDYTGVRPDSRLGGGVCGDHHDGVMRRVPQKREPLEMATAGYRVKILNVDERLWQRLGSL